VSLPLIIRPEAEADLAEAFTWYEAQRTVYFLSEQKRIVVLAVLHHRRNPNIWRKRSRQV
jgi:plasmid stabilization system protein ParE